MFFCWMFLEVFRCFGYFLVFLFKYLEVGILVFSAFWGMFSGWGAFYQFFYLTKVPFRG